MPVATWRTTSPVSGFSSTTSPLRPSVQRVAYSRPPWPNATAASTSSPVARCSRCASSAEPPSGPKRYRSPPRETISRPAPSNASPVGPIPRSLDVKPVANGVAVTSGAAVAPIAASTPSTANASTAADAAHFATWLPMSPPQRAALHDCPAGPRTSLLAEACTNRVREIAVSPGGSPSLQPRARGPAGGVEAAQPLERRGERLGGQVGGDLRVTRARGEEGGERLGVARGGGEQLVVGEIVHQP